ncbi:hypothetical protein Tco_0503502, partial [Tanacetum coccineum]
VRVRRGGNGFFHEAAAKVFEDYLLTCAKFGESADSNLQLACAEAFKMKINVMKVEV